MRTVAQASLHPVLGGIRSGAVTGLVIVAMLGLPVLLVLGVKAPVPAESEARVWAATPEAPARVWAEPPAARAPVTTALAEPLPFKSSPSASSRPESSPVEAPRVRAGELPARLGLDLIPVLDDESGVLALEELPAPVVKPGRRPPAAPRVSRTP